MNPYYIGGAGRLVPMSRQELDDDPLGVVWIFEEPKPNAKYVMGVDAAQGVPGWTRRTRSDAVGGDNGCLSVWRVYSRGNVRYEQVAEYAAPVDPEDLALTANLVGRLYGVHPEDPDGQCLTIVEVYPGPGGITQRRMIREGYCHFWRPKYENVLHQESPRNVIGFTSNYSTRQRLWITASKKMIEGSAKIRSPWLVEECADCRPDAMMLTGRAAQGNHDDRVVAALLAIYAMSGGADYDVESTQEKVTTKRVEWQAADCTAEEQQEAWEERFQELIDRD